MKSTGQCNGSIRELKVGTGEQAETESERQEDEEKDQVRAQTAYEVYKAKQAEEDVVERC